jgi:hypothetical protein
MPPTHVLIEIREAQVPLLSALLLGGMAAKTARALRVGSLDAGLGPTALFPMRLRRRIALSLFAAEFLCGIALIATAGRIGRGDLANAVRLATSLLFLVATCALIELRNTHPDVGCGCFGDFSTSPVSGRTIVRSTLLSAAALATIGLPPLRAPHPGVDAARLLAIFAVEFAVIAALSPELGEALVRLGYSEPCELRRMPAVRTLAALRRSSQWRRRSGLITAEVPVDMWRELCWRYVVFPARLGEREAEVVFAVYLRPHRPVIHAALVDAATSEVLSWPAAPTRRGVAGWLPGAGRRRSGGPAGPARLDADPLDADLFGADRFRADRFGADRFGTDRFGTDRRGPDREGLPDGAAVPGAGNAPVEPRRAAQAHPGRPRPAAPESDDPDHAPGRLRIPAGMLASTDPGNGIPAIRMPPPPRPRTAGPQRSGPRPPGPGSRPPGSPGDAPGDAPGGTGSPAAQPPPDDLPFSSDL